MGVVDAGGAIGEEFTARAKTGAKGVSINDKANRLAVSFREVLFRYCLLD
jgi:hypothetical protein